MKIETTKWMTVPLAMGLLMGGCSSSPDVDDEMPVEGAEEAAVAMPDADEMALDLTPPTVQEAGTPGEAFRDAARWFPEEAFFVTAATGDSTWEEMEAHGLPFEHVGLEAGDDGTSEALRQDMEEFLVEIMGFDVLSVREAVSSVTVDAGMMAVMFGEFPEPTHLEAVPVGEYGDAYRVDLDLGHDYDEVDEAYGDVEVEIEGFDLTQFTEENEELYVMPVDEPRPAMLMTDDLEMLERMHAGEATMAADDEVSELLQGADGHHTVMVMLGELLAEDLELEPEERAMLPDHSLVGVGEAGMELTMLGDDAGLEVIAESLAMVVGMLQEGATAAYETRHEAELVEDVLIAHGYHLVIGLQHEMEPIREEGRLSYELEFAGEPGYLAALMSIGSLAYLSWEILDPMGMFEEWL